MKTTWNMRTTIPVLRVLRPAADGSFQRRKRFVFLFSSSATSPARMCSDLGAREALCLSFQFRPPDNSQWQDAESKGGVFFAPGNRPCGAMTWEENNGRDRVIVGLHSDLKPCVDVRVPGSAADERFLRSPASRGLVFFERFRSSPLACRSSLFSLNRAVFFSIYPRANSQWRILRATTEFYSPPAIVSAAC